ncbi:TetR/AcrR family transcriptional regulator [Ferrimonas marina]|uniref:DNA-binding transcriptional regulator, AcrR family n=1 Tax=Ferrimonas marina TaxID=299255 RepID=A0A1M5MJZ8_9GAMM|nr:TetR/AcrR family transcriptional regulator [Ferrimonas marina]SHG77824.1 DNA-binding transcriptional regulator, AcrR family [Ferrimonas marina]
MSKGERTRQQILHQGLVFSSQFGLADVTIGNLSSLCDLSRTGVISHFKNKEDMQIAILEYSELRFTEWVLKPARDPDPLTHLHQLFTLWQGWTVRMLEQEQTSCPLIKALVEFQHRPDSAVKRFALDQQARLLSYLGKLVQRAVDSHQLAPGTHADALAYQLFALNLGHTIAQSANPDPNSPQWFEQRVRAWLSPYQH